MSICVTTDIFCDGDECSDWVHGTTGPRPNSKDARTSARRAGWLITSRHDLCPTCRRRPSPKDSHNG